ncbi:hypothetical protein [Tahibacter amnicola]|uniref:Uncharacterized protein n=1 Tax=Tahibacter amnicola TaxID=2976241 RepID=A0ABY6BF31_9GAMM|nr:hypothetical protein [Tahibacter amnicola]UXI68474.1 hypothetical protein N4264_02135 [Tahibacter amnicola]
MNPLYLLTAHAYLTAREYPRFQALRCACARLLELTGKSPATTAGVPAFDNAVVTPTAQGDWQVTFSCEDATYVVFVDLEPVSEITV